MNAKHTGAATKQELADYIGISVEQVRRDARTGKFDFDNFFSCADYVVHMTAMHKQDSEQAECRHGVSMDFSCNGCSDSGNDPRRRIRPSGGSQT